MQSKLLFFLFIIFWQAAGAQVAYRGLPFSKNYSPDEYQGGIQNWHIAQDQRGILYVANNFALLEFDGSEWNNYPVKNSTKVRSVAIDSHGKIYVGSQGDFGYFFPDKVGTLVYTSLADSLPNKYRNIEETWNIYIENEKIYFCTFENIFIYENEKLSIIESGGLLEFSFLVGKTLYSLSKGVGLTYLNDGQLKLIPGGEIFADKTVTEILQYNKNEIVIITLNHGIFRYDGNKIKPWNQLLKSFETRPAINCAKRLKKGYFAFGTQDRGLIVVNMEGEVVWSINKAQGLASRTVLSMYEDDSENLWLGLNNGLAFLELGSPFSLINENIIPGTGYASYLDKQNLYLGTNSGLFIKNPDNAEFEKIENTNGQVYRINKLSGQILLGHHNGLFSIENAKATPLSNSTAGGWIFKKLKNHPNLMIAGTYYGLQLFELKNEKWHFVKILEGFDESSRVLEEDGDYLWMAHGYKGVFRIELTEDGRNIKETKFYNSKDGFPTDILINVFSINNRLIFPAENGIFRYDKMSDRFIRDEIFSKYFRADTHIREIEEDIYGNIYFIEDQSMGVLKKQSNAQYEKQYYPFAKLNGKFNDDLENITALNPQNILIDAKEGFIHYDPTLSSQKNRLIEVLIRKVEIISNNDSLVFNGNFVIDKKVVINQPEKNVLTLDFDDNSIRFAFTSPHYEDVGQLQYQYQLEKFDDHWSEWTNKAEKDYTNLPEGNYTFKVKARNLHHDISKEATYQFTVLAPWYRTKLAYALYTLATLGLFVLGLSLVDRKHKKDKVQMQADKIKELSEKDSQLETISKKSEEEITNLRNEKLESEILHKNKELATSTMLILNKNEFISGVKNGVENIISVSTNPEVKTELNQIVKDITKNLAHDKDWEHFEFHFDQVHGDFSQRLRSKYSNLTPQEMKLSAYLRLNLSSKEIANLLNITVRGVEISRYRLRKKLGLNRENNLTEFILNF